MVTLGRWFVTSLASLRSKNGVWEGPPRWNCIILWFLHTLGETHYRACYMHGPCIFLFQFSFCVFKTHGRALRDAWPCTFPNLNKITFFHHSLLRIKLRCLHDIFRYGCYLSIGFGLTSIPHPQLELWSKYYMCVNTVVHPVQA